LKGANAVVIGRSSIVGFPLFHLLLNKNATVTLCHSHTANLSNLTKHADIVISAVGVPRLVK
jgi:methylenetetrahydrofolate dehydrogenase (NADP+)/methenyltetrahydrofolate cyclohydrolase